MSLFTHIRFYIFVFFLVLCNVHSYEDSFSDGFLCVQKTSCSCLGTDGKLIDLSPLVTDSKPLISANTSYLYIYHPCTDSSLNGNTTQQCSKAYGLCYFEPKTKSNKPIDLDDALSNKIVGNFSRLALNNESVFVSTPKELNLVYKHYNENKVITTIVKLMCDENEHRYNLYLEKKEPTEHVLVLKSNYICMESEHYMSKGAVFFLIILILVTVYFVGGMLVLKFIRGATGLEVIPNRDFWCKVIQAVKDGFMYVVSCGKAQPDSYEKI